MRFQMHPLSSPQMCLQPANTCTLMPPCVIHSKVFGSSFVMAMGLAGHAIGNGFDSRIILRCFDHLHSCPRAKALWNAVEVVGSRAAAEMSRQSLKLPPAFTINKTAPPNGKEVRSAVWRRLVGDESGLKVQHFFLVMFYKVCYGNR